MQNNTPLILFFCFFALVAGVVGAMGGYKYGYELAAEEAKTALIQKDAEKEKALAEVRAQLKERGTKGGEEKKEKEPFAPSSLSLEALASVPGLSELSSDAQETAVYLFNNIPGACQPCQETNRSLGQCYLDISKLLDQKICVNIPTLTKRVVKQAKAGASVDAIRAVVDLGTWMPIDPGNNPSTGPKDAKVTLIEVSDFQCPYCKKALPVLKEVQEKYGNKIRKVFVNLPLAMHKMAPPAAKAALAAHLQGKFWAFHDALFSAPKLDEEEFKKIASDLSLDMSRFEKDRGSMPVDQALQADIAKVTKLGISSTPTFFVNGYRIKGVKPLEIFSQYIDAELNDL
jgi:protein-disulfide isomerase